MNIDTSEVMEHAECKINSGTSFVFHLAFRFRCEFTEFSSANCERWMWWTDVWHVVCGMRIILRCFFNFRCSSIFYTASNVVWNKPLNRTSSEEKKRLKWNWIRKDVCMCEWGCVERSVEALENWQLYLRWKLFLQLGSNSVVPNANAKSFNRSTNQLTKECSSQCNAIRDMIDLKLIDALRMDTWRTEVREIKEKWLMIYALSQNRIIPPSVQYSHEI